MKNYTATYEGRAIAGTAGFWWRLYSKGRLVAEGWTAGKKRHAEDEVHHTIDAREVLRSFVEAA